MKKYGHSNRNILLLNRNYNCDLTEYAPMIERAMESEDNQRHDMPDEVLPELIDGRKNTTDPIGANHKRLYSTVCL